MTAVTCPDRAPDTVDPMPGLWFSTACRHCPEAPALREVNAGHADGCRSTWVGACPSCGRHFAVTASIAQVSGRGVRGVA